MFKNLPVPFPLSTINLQYFNLCVVSKKYQVDNIDHYMIFYENEYADWLNEKDKADEFAINNEKQWLTQIGIQDNVTVIQYSDLFLNNIDTNTVFDQYKDEIQMYTKANIKCSMDLYDEILWLFRILS